MWSLASVGDAAVSLQRAPALPVPAIEAWSAALPPTARSGIASANAAHPPTSLHRFAIPGSLRRVRDRRQILRRSRERDHGRPAARRRIGEVAGSTLWPSMGRSTRILLAFVLALVAALGGSATASADTLQAG